MIEFEKLQAYSDQPLVLLALFALANLLMIWRLNAMEGKGFEGTVLGTLIMPYCSGFANLSFAYVMSSSAANGSAVLENTLVNNATNLTLILGLSALFGAAAILPQGKTKAKGRSKAKGQPHAEQHRLNRLNLMFTLIALFLFTGTLWALGKDGELSLYDGLILVALFVFWQVLHVFEILKDNIRKDKSIHWSIAIDLALIAASAWLIYFSVDHLVERISTSESTIISFAKIGWFSGLLMVLPNAFLALYYSRIGRQDIVLSSQVGDAHICIPMSIGLFALFHPVAIPASFELGIYLILGAGVVHFLSVALLGRLPRLLGGGLVAAYAVFLYQGLIG